MLIEKYDLDVFTPPCEPGAERFSAMARFNVDIHQVLPYLNATLRGAVYNPAVPALTWKKGGHTIVFQPNQIAISNVEDRQAAVDEVDGLVKLVNRTWERREDITPDHEARRRPTPMEVYKLLPRTNCKECGQPTCWGFALKLAASQVQLTACAPLFQPEYASQLAQLQTIITDMPAIG